MKPPSQAESLTQLLAPYAHLCREDLQRWLVEPDVPEDLAQAMRYCIEGGKRIRAALVLLCCRAAGGDQREEMPRRAAVAIECIHAYSLVHDDLPAMDDDTLRRGRPTAHVKFGEAMAILVGDALLTRAFGLLCETGDRRGTALAGILASAAGAGGMIAGQVADMDLCRVPEGMAGVEYIHHRKTGALIEASARMGALCAGAGERAMENVMTYARQLGMAFQIADDVLDVTGQAENIGKTPGKDARSGKRTTVAQIGIHAARERIAEHTRRALEAAGHLGDRAEPLVALARGLAQRTR
jgi:geranylgeranyl pyrophosphate synthase